MRVAARPRRLVVVGASLAGLRAVEGARDAGFDGDITLIGDERLGPYDRTVLSKGFLEAEDEPGPPLYREADALRADLETELLLGAPAHGLDTWDRTVRAGGRTVGYDALVIATGVRPRRPAWAVPLAGVHLLRTVADARALRASLATSRHVAVVGGGFVGSEVASSARHLGLTVTMVEAMALPLARHLGTEAAQECADLHRAHGTRLRCGVTVTALDGGDRVERILLSDGSTVEADTVVVGVGARPNTEWLEGSGVTVGDGVECDAYLRTRVPSVHAAGDVAQWYNAFLGRRTRLEHWTNASSQAAAAARNAISGEPAAPHTSLPYFWSEWYGRRVQFVGDTDADESVCVGDPTQHSFVRLYRRGDRLVGVLAMDRKGAVAKFRGMVRRGTPWHQALEHARGHAKKP